MKLLAIDTATEQCSAAIVSGDSICVRSIPTARSHADLILPMVDEVLSECGVTLSQLDGLAFGRGPGSFTGVRIATSVVQGLALAAKLPVAGVSNLAAVARQVATRKKLSPGAQVLVCMDARMSEVYWARYDVGADGSVILVGDEHVGGPDRVRIDIEAANTCGAGTGWRAYPTLKEEYPLLSIVDDVLPQALDIARLAIGQFESGQVVQAADAQPVYLRDQVVTAPRQ